MYYPSGFENIYFVLGLGHDIIGKHEEFRKAGNENCNSASTHCGNVKTFEHWEGPKICIFQQNILKHRV